MSADFHIKLDQRNVQRTYFGNVCLKMGENCEDWAPVLISWAAARLHQAVTPLRQGSLLLNQSPPLTSLTPLSPHACSRPQYFSRNFHHCSFLKNNFYHINHHRHHHDHYQRCSEPDSTPGRSFPSSHRGRPGPPGMHLPGQRQAESAQLLQVRSSEEMKGQTVASYLDGSWFEIKY